MDRVELNLKMMWLTRHHNPLEEWFTDDERKYIKDLAEQCRKTELYKRTEPLVTELIEKWAKKRPIEIYNFLLRCAANSHNTFELHGSSIMLIPILDSRLDVERKKI